MRRWRDGRGSSLVIAVTSVCVDWGVNDVRRGIDQRLRQIAERVETGVGLWVRIYVAV